jgi:pyrroline-5-carboxylate reductase
MNVAFIGAGKMAEAILRSLLGTEIVAPFEVMASDADASRPAALAAELKIQAAPSNVAAADWADVVFLCVKPQQLEDVLRELAGTITDRHLVISIAAGKKLATIEARLRLARVIRVMPNVCCLVGEGMNVFTLGAKATEEDADTAMRLLGSCGAAHTLPEAQFDAVTALSGSGPAFFARFLIHLVEGAKAEGLSADDAEALAVQTMAGTAALLRNTTLTPEQLIANVTSAKGTTAEGLAVLDQSDFAAVIRATVAAAARRSRELSQPS